MSKNLPATQDIRVSTYKARSGDTITLSIDVVKNFLVFGKKELVTDQEVILYMGICRSLGMDPFAKDVYLVKYDSNPAAPIVAIDFYRSRARAQADCKGWAKGVICLKKDGSLRYSNGLVLPTEELVGGWFRAQPAGWDNPFELEVNLSGYKKGNSFWTPEKAPTMIAKVAESQGLRTLWPKEFKGTLTAEEIGELSEALTTTGDLLPPAGDAGEPESEPEALDFTAFDALVEPMMQGLSPEEHQLRAQHLKDYLEVNAKAIKEANKKTKMTLHQAQEKLLEMACKLFGPYKDAKGNDQPGFWNKFLGWEAEQYPPETPPVVEPGAEAGPAEKAEAEAAAGEPEGPGTEEETFEARAHRVWGLVVKKYGSTKDMKTNVGIARSAEITPDNVNEIEEKVTA